MKYTYSIGRRKKSTATVRLFKGTGDSMVNEKSIDEVFSSIADKQTLMEPFVVTGTEGKFYFTVRATGGGKQGQLGAIRLGISRALVKTDEKYKKPLKERGLMTRDSRMTERKKTGLKKARKAPQFSKR